MKKAVQQWFLLILSLAVCLFLTACQGDMAIPESVGDNSQDADPIPIDDNAINAPFGTETNASFLSAGLTSIPYEDGVGRVYEYNGGEISFKASVLAEGTYYNNLGFMLYLNGAAVPFVMEGVDDDEAAYFHILRDVSDQGELLYQYRCTPYGAAAGEEAIINVLCFAQPEYMYDPGTGPVSGPFYAATQYIAMHYSFIVRFFKSAPAVKDVPELETMPLITNVTITEDSDEQGFIEELNATCYRDSSTKMTLERRLEQGVQYIDYYDGIYDASGQVCIDGKDTVHVRYRVLGEPKAKITFAFATGAAFVPVLIDGADSYSFTCKKGVVYTIEADIDVSGVTEATTLRCNIFRDDLIDSNRAATFYFTAQ